MALTPTISAQRTCETNQGLVVRRRNEWGAKRSYTDDNPVSTAVFIFLHISITNPGAYSSEDRHAQAIENIGISRFPNTGISYNMMVMPSGRVFEGQPLGRRGAHTVNTFNRRTCSTSGCPNRTTSLGPNNNLNFSARAIVLAQNVDDPVTSVQLHSIARIGAAWKRCGYVTRGARLHGHRCVTAKSCPGNIAWTHMGTINKLIEDYTVDGLGPAPEPPPALPVGADMPLIIQKGASVFGFVTGDRWTNIPQGDAVKIRDQAKAQGSSVPIITGLSTEGIAALQNALVSEEPAEESTPPGP